MKKIMLLLVMIVIICSNLMTFAQSSNVVSDRTVTFYISTDIGVQMFALTCHSAYCENYYSASNFVRSDKRSAFSCCEGWSGVYFSDVYTLPPDYVKYYNGSSYKKKSALDENGTYWGDPDWDSSFLVESNKIIYIYGNSIKGKVRFAVFCPNAIYGTSSETLVINF